MCSAQAKRLASGLVGSKPVTSMPLCLAFSIQRLLHFCISSGDAAPFSDKFRSCIVNSRAGSRPDPHVEANREAARAVKGESAVESRREDHGVQIAVGAEPFG